MLTVGDKFPSFDLTAVPGGPEGLKGDFVNITDHTNPDKWKVIFFWPMDFTFVCPTEIVGFGKLNSEFEKRDAVVYGASIDSEWVHLNWRLANEDLKNLPIPMLSDVKRELVESTGIVARGGGVALRATFIVCPKGYIRHVSVNDLSVGRNPEEILRILDGLQTGKNCGCNWHKGDDFV